MDPTELFKRLFGFPSGFFHHEHNSEENFRGFDDEGLKSNDDEGENFGNDFTSVFDEMEKQFAEIHKAMESMFHGFTIIELPQMTPFEHHGTSQLPSGKPSPREYILKNPNESSQYRQIPRHPQVPEEPHAFHIPEIWRDKAFESPKSFHLPPGYKSPREFIFKNRNEAIQPSERLHPPHKPNSIYTPEVKQDKDLDKEVMESGLDDVLSRSPGKELNEPAAWQKPGHPWPFGHWWSYSSTTSTYTEKDGVKKSETKHTITDSEGNKETVIITQDGDKQNITTSRGDNPGSGELRGIIEKVFGDSSEVLFEWKDNTNLESPVVEARKEKDKSIFRRLFGF